MSRDHPRGCGENSNQRLYSCILLGSPPRMRGKLAAQKRDRAHAGITPADAGKTLRHIAPRYRVEDHPRGCGENSITFFLVGVLEGSPPRMRGKRLCSQTPTVGNRITPADAGKTCTNWRRHASAEDHPRGCGENRVQQVRRTKGGGSPPRMRGKLKISFANSHGSRITPADAGKTRPPHHRRRAREDHPRGCGENPALCIELPWILGSPPRMRGKPTIRVFSEHDIRITPADAGKTVAFMVVLLSR